MPFPAVHPALDRALINKGYAEPTPVQAAVLEGEHAERDLLVSAQTGSGKTVAFGLAAAPTLLGDKPIFGPGGAPLCLAIAAAGMLDAQTRFENSARRTAQTQPDHLAEEIVEQVQAKIAFRANAAALKTADDMTGALLDILA